ncbi:hypothetical protein SAMN05192570_0098 [Brevundimonas viscosa]|uniref:Uncharacterized protein n=2 Tax=Brevundimonas viscosa TaxID=871741 RepID=A0A1I6TIS5_9CAUL|nr:hypothetical protein SAMN05192570_0098 [Brevundimonas viscosa]
MLTLGDLMARARSAAPVLEGWLDEAAPDLAMSVRSAAAARGESPAAFARAALVEFDRYAGPEAWTRLTGRLHAAGDPGLACLEEMVRWRLSTAPALPMEDAR